MKSDKDLPLINCADCRCYIRRWNNRKYCHTCRLKRIRERSYDYREARKNKLLKYEAALREIALCNFQTLNDGAQIARKALES